MSKPEINKDTMDIISDTRKKPASVFIAVLWRSTHVACRTLNKDDVAVVGWRGRVVGGMWGNWGVWGWGYMEGGGMVTPFLEVEEEVVAQLGVGDDVVGGQVSAEGADGAAAALRRVAAITSAAHRHRRSTPSSSSSSSSQSAPQRRPAAELALTPTHAHTTTDAAVHRPAADAGPVHDAVVAVDAVDGHHEPVVLAAADAGRVEVAGGGGAPEEDAGREKRAPVQAL